MIAINFINGCSEASTEPGFPQGPDSSIVTGYNDALKKIGGAYNVINGKEILGDPIFIKVVPPSISLITGVNSRIAVLYGGIRNNRFCFEGKMRNADNTELNFIQLNFDICSDSIINGAIPEELVAVGNYGNSLDRIDKPIKIVLKRRIDYDKDSFSIIGHRGGGSIGGSFPVPENSLAIISLAELYGANAVEIDVQLTKDRVPIVYQDETINKRAVNTEFLTGYVRDIYFCHIREFAVLKNEEKIPTLEEMLDHILYRTTIKTVWLDIKNAESVNYTLPIQIEYNEKAKSIEGRTDFRILAGLAYEETFNSYMQNPDRSKAPALCELGIEQTKDSDAQVWAPRWTLGIPEEDIETIHSWGKKVFFWTVDDINFMGELFNYGKADRILTNFPQTVFYEKFKNDIK